MPTKASGVRRFIWCFDGSDPFNDVMETADAAKMLGAELLFCSDSRVEFDRPVNPVYLNRQITIVKGLEN